MLLKELDHGFRHLNYCGRGEDPQKNAFYIFLVICRSYIIVQHAAHNLIPKSTATLTSALALTTLESDSEMEGYDATTSEKNGKTNRPGFGQI